MFSLTELGLIVLVVGIAITLGNLAFFSNQIKTTTSENIQMKQFVAYLLKELRDAGKPADKHVPPFLTIDVDGDANIGGDVIVGRKL